MIREIKKMSKIDFLKKVFFLSFKKILAAKIFILLAIPISSADIYNNYLSSWDKNDFSNNYLLIRKNNETTFQYENFDIFQVNEIKISFKKLNNLNEKDLKFCENIKDKKIEKEYNHTLYLNNNSKKTYRFKLTNYNCVSFKIKHNPPGEVYKQWNFVYNHNDDYAIRKKCTVKTHKDKNASILKRRVMYKNCIKNN